MSVVLQEYGGAQWLTREGVLLPPRYGITPAVDGIMLPFQFDTLAQQGIQVTSFDGGEPGDADLLVDTPADYNGDIYRGWTMPSRDVVFGLYVAAPTQTGFLYLRDQLFAAAQLGSTVTVTAIRGDGITRSIAGVVSALTSGTDEDSVGINWQVFAVTVHCSDPFWKGPAAHVPFVVLPQKSFFAAPFFPVLLQSGSINQTATITVQGTQPAAPQWALTGPFTAPVQLFIPGGPSLTLNYAAAAGEIVTIDCRPGYQSVVSSLGTNLFPKLSATSQLFTLPVGQTRLQAIVDGATPQTALTLSYTGQWQSV